MVSSIAAGNAGSFTLRPVALIATDIVIADAGGVGGPGNENYKHLAHAVGTISQTPGISSANPDALSEQVATHQPSTRMPQLPMSFAERVQSPSPGGHNGPGGRSM